MWAACPLTVADQPGRYWSERTSRPGQSFVTVIFTYVGEYETMFAELAGFAPHAGLGAILSVVSTTALDRGSKFSTWTAPSGKRAGSSFSKSCAAACMS